MAKRDEPANQPVPGWLAWSRAPQGIAQAGLTTYSHDGLRPRALPSGATSSGGDCGSGSGGDPEGIEAFFASERGYPTPKIDVRAAVVIDDLILLVQERDDEGWALPGGWADIGESAGRAVERETREEAGIEVDAIKLLALYDRELRGHPRHPEYSYKAIFACRARGPAQPRPGPETLDARFFPADGLPELSLARVLPEQIALAFAHAHAPGLPTEFD